MTAGYSLLWQSKNVQGLKGYQKTVARWEIGNWKIPLTLASSGALVTGQKKAGRE